MFTILIYRVGYSTDVFDQYESAIVPAQKDLITASYHYQSKTFKVQEREFSKEKPNEVKLYVTDHHKGLDL